VSVEGAVKSATPAAGKPTAENNIAAHLPRQAVERPYARSVVVPRDRGSDGKVAYAHLTFEQLDALADRYAHALVKDGIQRGDRVLILVKPGFDLIACIFAVFKAGAVAVFIDPGMGLGGLVDCVAAIEPRGFIGVSKAHAAFSVLGRRALRSVTTRLCVGGGMGWGALCVDGRPSPDDAAFPVVPMRPSDPAAVLFTSGSTGPAKGVVYEHGMFQAQVRMLRDVYGIEPGEVDLPGLPVFALFSVALGTTAVFPDMDPTRPARVDPTLFVESIQDHGVTYSFGSPTIWGRVSRYCAAQQIQLPSLRRVLMAGCAVPPAVHERLETILSGDADTHTPYGATEALPVASASGRDLKETFAATREGAGTCVGRPLPDVQVRIIAIDDEPIEAWSGATALGIGERGEIVVTGPTVTKEYCERPEATRAAKIKAEDGTLWHRMGDMGYLDPEGRLWFLGRKTQRVVTSEGTLYPAACEAIFNEHPHVLRSALVGLGERGSQTAAIVVEPEPDAFPTSNSLATFTAEVLALGAKHTHTAGIQRVLFHRGFPVDVRHNAKIRRGELAVWAAKQG
jgi:olefin beta-lactone synthetase